MLTLKNQYQHRTQVIRYLHLHYMGLPVWVRVKPVSRKSLVFRGYVNYQIIPPTLWFGVSSLSVKVRVSVCHISVLSVEYLSP